jgi:4-diphosphocytidyl-2-C-methyl-D-erythritol kinase
MARPLQLRAVAPAKVNLGLAVVGQRPDGYHDLVTLMQAISLYDLFDWTDTGQPFRYEGPSGVPPESDLVVRVFADAPDRAAWTGSLRLTKQIPLAAGLGGGSTDAALALRLAFPDVPLNELHERAVALGADVPFFLRGGTALATGTGTTLDWIPTPRLWLVLVTPPLAIERKTAVLYAGLESGDFSDGSAVRSVADQVEDLDDGVAELPNAFLRQLLGYDMVRYAYDALCRAADGSAAVSVSGAGPTIYALTDQWRTARSIAERLPENVGRIQIVRSIAANDSGTAAERMARALRGASV